MEFKQLVLALLLAAHYCILAQDVEPECFQAGECRDSTVKDIIHAEDSQECLERAQRVGDAQFFTFYDATGDCYAFGNCNNFDETTCADCVSGPVNCLDLQCWSEGACDGGTEITNFQVFNSEECRITCQTEDDCSWFTFDEAAFLCTLYSGECSNITPCESCYTSQKYCYRREKSLRPKKVILIGGSISDGTGDNEYTNFVQLFDLEESGECFLATYPHTADGPTAGFVEPGIIKSCGGEGPDDLSYCYDYQPLTDTWTDAPRLSDTRYWPRSAHVEGGLWLVTGGTPNYIGDDVVNNATTDVWDGQQFYPGPTLVGASFDGHCQVGLDGTHVFIADGETGNVWILDWDTQTFNPTAPMRPKQYPGCGKVINSNGETEVVVASEGTSEIFNFASQTWRAGPDLPDYGFRYGYDQIFDTFVLVGGVDMREFDYVFLDTILQFDPIHYKWITKSHVLFPPRYGPAVVALPGDTLDCV